MKVLFIGGTGTISTAVSELAVQNGVDLYLLNRGTSNTLINGANSAIADINDLEAVRAVIDGHHFDAIVNWIVFTPEQIARDIDLFTGKCNQYIFISSASAYQKPLTHPIITESTPLSNPYWEYSRNKIACEERLMRAYREDGFPVTIIRPSHTYDRNIPAAIGNGNSYVIAKRILEGKPVIAHGDGSSLWTLTHSADFAKGFLGIVGNPQAIGHAIHITSDYLLTWNQIYEQIGDALGVAPHIVHIPSDFIAEKNPDLGAGLLGDKMWSVIFDNRKIKRFVPDYAATIPFHIGIRRALAWFQSEDERMQVKPEDDVLIDSILDAYHS
ncbi:MAG: SDR family oxidoreductase [Phototrophicaceae bacterium]